MQQMSVSTVWFKVILVVFLVVNTPIPVKEMIILEIAVLETDV